MSAVEAGPVGQSGVADRMAEPPRPGHPAVVSACSISSLSPAPHGPHASPAQADLQQRYQQMATELNLKPQQRTGFDPYVAAMRTRTEKMHQVIAPLVGAPGKRSPSPMPPM